MSRRAASVRTSLSICAMLLSIVLTSELTECSLRVEKRTLLSPFSKAERSSFILRSLRL
ncbi:hypothetical protein [uncultured Muribaculum sp.]|uniref:hypothetical protein n=1 Tax=uncultured Muribaculum sp. TaxID=1918613 RepID=UPI0025B79B35|nr:hypothetical protein [uncultured Muribaculum sp.]